MSKYTDSANIFITEFADSYKGEQIPYTDVMEFVDKLNNSDLMEDAVNFRSLSAKLRFSGYKLETKPVKIGAKTFTEEDEAVILEMTSDPDNMPFLEDIAERLGKGVKQVQGKLVSMRISGVYKKEKAVAEKAPRLFSEEDEAVILEMTSDENNLPFIEDIAERLGKEVKKLRGKLASMKIRGIKTKNPAPGPKKVFTEEVKSKIAHMNNQGIKVPEIASKLGLNEISLRCQMGKMGILKKAEKVRFWNDERVAKLESMIQEGLDRAAIAEALETTELVVAKKMKEYMVIEEADND